MEFDNNAVDIISLVIILVSVFLSFSRGLIREYTLSYLGYYLFFLQFNLDNNLPVILDTPFLDEFLLGNRPLAIIISYVITFVLSITFFSIILIVFNILNQTKLKQL